MVRVKDKKGKESPHIHRQVAKIRSNAVTSWRLRFISAFTISFDSITRLELRQPWPLAWKKSRGV
jgi:hypothetical protein